MTSRIHVKPGQSVMDAYDEATKSHDKYERAHQRGTMTFELGIDHVVLNGHRILRPSGVARSSWEKFWSAINWKIINLH